MEKRGAIFLSGEKMERWIIWWLIVIGIIILGYVMPHVSTYSIPGDFCGDDDKIAEYNCCNYPTSYCERFWYPVHCYYVNGAFETWRECK